MRMGNDLTVMMLIEVDPGKSTLLTAALQGGAMLSDYKIFTHTLDPAGAVAPEPGTAARKSSRFNMAAPDKPGLIHLVTSAFLCLVLLSWPAAAVGVSTLLPARGRAVMDPLPLRSAAGVLNRLDVSSHPSCRRLPRAAGAPHSRREL